MRRVGIMFAVIVKKGQSGVTITYKGNMITRDDMVKLAVTSAMIAIVLDIVIPKT